MNAPTIRRTSLVLFIILSCLYAWLALRDESSLRTISIIPNSVAVFFDNHFYGRNFFAFALMGLLCAAAVWRLHWQWVLTAVLVCFSAPLIKDLIQIGSVTRHFNWEATILGMLGALLGFAVGTKVASLLNGATSRTNRVPSSSS
jgi:hypothetical protein